MGGCKGPMLNVSSLSSFWKGLMTMTPPDLKDSDLKDLNLAFQAKTRDSRLILKEPYFCLNGNSLFTHSHQGMFYIIYYNFSICSLSVTSLILH